MALTRLQKISTGLAVGTFLLLAALGYAVHLVDPAIVMQLVAKQLKAETGRDLEIRGKVSLSLFPRISVAAEQVSLSNPSWAADPALLAAERLAVDIRWAPLWHDLVEIDHVTLERATLSLQTAPAGQDLKPSWVLEPSADLSASAGEENPLRIDLKEVRLEDVELRYRDALGEILHTAKVKSLDVNESGVGSRQMSRWNGTFDINGLPVSLTGETTSLARMMAGSANPAVIDIDLKTGLNGQTLQLAGQVTLSPGAAPALNLNIRGDGLDLRKLRALTAQGAEPVHPDAGGSRTSGDRVFSRKPIDFAALPVWQGNVSLLLKSLTLNDGLQLQQMATTLTAVTNQPGALSSLSMAPLDFQLGQGRVVANAQLRELNQPMPVIQLTAYATGFTLGQIMSELGENQKLSGGSTVVGMHLRSRGDSPQTLAANADGEIQMSIGPATFNSSLFDSIGDFGLSVLDAVNPLRKRSDVTQLECGVAYLPVQRGSIRIDHTVGTRSDRLDMSLDGMVNLGAETMSLNLSTAQRSGLTTGINPAGLVAITGSFKQPRLGINKTGVVKQAAGVGLAIVTGGMSLLAQNAAGVVSKSSPCDKVLRPWSQVTDGLASHQ